MNEDKTSQNEDYQEDDNEQSHEADSNTEGETEEASEGGEPDTVTLSKDELEQREREIRKDQDRRWKDRLKVAKEDDDDEQGKEDRQESNQAQKLENDRLDRLELRTEGVQDTKEQSAVIEYARWKNISVVEALNSPAMQAELKSMRDKRSTPRPSNRVGGQERDIDWHVQQFVKHGKSSNDPEIRRQVRNKLAGK